MIKTQLVGNRNFNATAELVSDRRTSPNGLVVYTEPYKVFQHQRKQFVNDDFGTNMNVDATFTGTPDLVHDGTDNTGWTATALSGTWDFSSTDQAFNGTQSIDATQTVNGDQALFTRASPLNTSNYEAFSLALYISKNTQAGDEDITIRFRLAGVSLGDPVSIDDFADFNLTDDWQEIGFLLDEANFSGDFDEIVITTLNTSGNFEYYLDVLRIQEVSGQATYTIEPDDGELIRVHSIEFSMVDNIASTLTDATMPRLSYNSILGVPKLSSAIVIRTIIRDRVFEDASITDMYDFLKFPGASIQNVFSDGTNTFLKVRWEFRDPHNLNADSRDRMEIIISSDLSGLLEFEAEAETGLSVTNSPLFENKNI